MAADLYPLLYSGIRNQDSSFNIPSRWIPQFLDYTKGLRQFRFNAMRHFGFWKSGAVIILSTTVIFSQTSPVVVHREYQTHENTVQRRSSCSGYYNFGINLINVVQQRSSKKDTVYVSACVAAGGQSYCFTKLYGKHGKGTFNPNINFQNIPVQDDESAVFSYLIINNGHGKPIDVETSLSNGTHSLAQQGISDAAQYQNTPVGETIAQFIGETFAKIVGFVVDIIGGFVDLFKEGCDGWLAAGVHGFRGIDICNGSAADLTGTDSSPGTQDEELFGFIPGITCNSQQSEYDVTWIVSVSNGSGNHTLPGTVFSKASRVGSSGSWWLKWVVGLACVFYILG